MAARIIEYRQKKGPFKKIEELMNVQGIGEKNFLKLKPQLTVGARADVSVSSRTIVAAFSFIEILFVLGAAATVSAVAVPETLATIDDSRTAAAARYVSTRLQRTRMEAVSRNGSAALRFTRRAGSLRLRRCTSTAIATACLSRDIQSGVDRVIQPADRFDNHFPGVEFGAIPDLPAVDSTGTAPGSDPIRLGSSDMVTFTPTGTATSGSLYIRGRRGAQYVVRVYGETGKTRVLKFNARRVANGFQPPASNDRRLAARTSAVSELGILQARVRPGHEASVIDISAHGALIETAAASAARQASRAADRARRPAYGDPWSRGAMPVARVLASVVCVPWRDRLRAAARLARCIRE